MSTELPGLTIHWLTSDRFDTKPDKSSWTEVGDALASEGASVNIITSFKDRAYHAEGKNVRMVYLNVLDLPMLYRVAFSWSAFTWLRKYAKKHDLIILNQHEMWMLPLLKWSKFNHIHLDIRTLPVVGDSLKDKLDVLLFWKLVMRLFGRSCTSYSFITQRLRRAIEDEFTFSYPDYTIWQSGVNTDFFVDRIQKSSIQVAADNVCTFFYHGSLYRRRGVDRVVDAFSRLPEDIARHCRLIVVGSGRGLNELRAQSERLGLGDRVEFRGLVPYEQIPLEISQADICICPLPDYPEWNVSSPLKVLEYMACARPMILTPIVAHTDVLADQDFVVWTRGDEVDDFVLAMEDAFRQKDELRDHAAKAPDLVRSEWDWSAHGKRFAQYLSKHYIHGNAGVQTQPVPMNSHKGP